MAAAERSELADFLDTLTPAEWERPSLRAGWTVRDVVAHAISCEERGSGDLARLLRRARLRPHRLNDVAIEEYRYRDPQELVAFLREHLEPRGATARFGGGELTGPGLQG